MLNSHRSQPRVLHYRDAVEGFRGHLALARGGYALMAGGFRVQLGLSAQTVSRLAEAMSLKQHALGLAVGGAKCGIDYDPASPGKREAMRRFLRFLRPWLLACYSMGPDMGTTWTEIEGLTQEEGIPSAKIAIAQAQGMSKEQFFERLRVLDANINGFTLGQRRAGHGLAHAALAVVDALGIARARARVGIQGFGGLGRGTALALHEAGVPVAAVSDLGGCLVNHRGLDVPRVLAGPKDAVNGGTPSERLFDVPLDVLILAAAENAVTGEQASRLQARAVIAGANLALAASVETLLHGRQTVVIPDFIGGCGGSASMDALFGPPGCPTPREVLELTGERVGGLVSDLIERSAREGVRPRDAALELCARNQRTERPRPYGNWGQKVEKQQLQVRED